MSQDELKQMLGQLIIINFLGHIAGIIEVCVIMSLWGAGFTINIIVHIAILTWLMVSITIRQRKISKLMESVERE